jgi:replicative DNA helicase
MTNYQHLAAIETEKDILCCMIAEPAKTIPLVRTEIVADDFFRTQHRLIFNALLNMYQNDETIEVGTIIPFLQKRGELDKVGGIVAISDIYNKYLGVGALDSYISTVKERAQRRNAIQQMDVAIAKASALEEELDLHDFMAEIAKIASARYVKERTMKDVALDFLEEIGNRASENPEDMCVVSGLRNLDLILHGFRKQELIYIAARPAMGKSALAIQFAINMALNQRKQVLYISLEMGERQILGRAIANLSEINSETVMYDSQLINKKEEYNKVLKAANAISKSGLYIRTIDVNTPHKIFNQALQIQGKHGLDAIIIDHVHLMDSDKEGESQNANMTKISKALKQMAIELDIPVIALAQLSRGVENRQDKHPVMSDLRDSGSLEQDADKVIMLYRDSYYNKSNRDDIVEIMVKKHRDGRLGDICVKFEKKYSKMTEAEFGGKYEVNPDVPV